VYNGYENEQSISYARVDNLFEDREQIFGCVPIQTGYTNSILHLNFFTNVRQIKQVK
jgi:hypothetical protein